MGRFEIAGSDERERLEHAVAALLGEFPAAGLALESTLLAAGWDRGLSTPRSSLRTR